MVAPPHCWKIFSGHLSREGDTLFPREVFTLAPEDIRKGGDKKSIIELTLSTLLIWTYYRLYMGNMHLYMGNWVIWTSMGNWLIILNMDQNMGNWAI